MSKKHDYTKHFVAGEGKEDLVKLAEKYNSKGFEEELDKIEAVDRADEAMLEEEITYETYSDEDEVDSPDNRDKSQIYIMTSDEWNSNETDYTQVTLNYYPEDDVLTDANDRPLRSVERVVGPDALSNFGTFSDDENVVYVCNPRTNAEYEILLQNGSYSDLVLGQPARKIKPKGPAIVHNVFEDAANEDLEVEEEDDET